MSPDIANHGSRVFEARKIGFQMRHCHIKNNPGCHPFRWQVKTDDSISDDSYVEAKVRAVTDRTVHTETRNRACYKKISDAFVLKMSRKFR